MSLVAGHFSRAVTDRAKTSAVAAALLLGAAAPAAAQRPLDDIVRAYRDSTAAVEGSLRTYALALFGLLALAEFAYAAIQLAFKSADFSEWLAELTNQVLFIGFFLSLLLFSGEWATAIVASFRQAGNEASIAAGGGTNASPSDILGIGIGLAGRVLEQSSVLTPVDSLGYVISALILLICFAFIALFLIEALVQSYIIIAAGALFMGFGGSRWTKDFAIKIITAALGAGAKLFVLQLLVGLGEGMMRGWLDAGSVTYEGIFVMIGASVVMLGLTRNVPDLVQGLVNGGAFQGGGGLLGATAAVGGAAGGFAGGMAGAGLAVAGAGRLASEQLATQAASGGGAPSRIGRLAALTGGTMRNLGSAAADDVGAKIGGRAHHGTMPGRMADRLHSEARVMRADRQRQTAAGATGPSANVGPRGDAGRASPNDTANTIGPA